jgi:hypothetical protein
MNNTTPANKFDMPATFNPYAQKCSDGVKRYYANLSEDERATRAASVKAGRHRAKLLKYHDTLPESDRAEFLAYHGIADDRI